MKLSYKVDDLRLLSSTGEFLIVGSAFAFIKPEFLSQKGNRWIQRLFNPMPNPGGKVVSLLGIEPLDLPGVTTTVKDCPKLLLRSITSDKMVYQTEDDSIHLFLFEPEYANRERTLIIDLNNNEHSRHVVALGSAGQAEITLRDLNAGQYAAHFFDDAKAEQYCQFTVADYKLAALSASLVSQELDNGIFKARLRIASFGTAVTDEFNVELLDGVNKIYSTTAESLEGNLNLNLKLEGQGPHQISLQLASDASKTASVAIIGSRKTERESTVFSPLTPELHGSLIPGSNSRDIKGIFLTEGADANTPLSVKSFTDGKIEIQTEEDFDTLVLVAINPLHPQQLENVVEISKHPASLDKAYARAEQLFKLGGTADALSIVQECISDVGRPIHPYYHYLKACCHAKLGDRPQAMNSLRSTVQNGWCDYEYFARDEDLQSLRDYDPFIELCTGGFREVSVGAIKAGQIITLDVFAPISIVTMGGFIKGRPWEGWTTAFSKTTIPGDLIVDATCKPGKEVKIEWQSLLPSSFIYCVVKDKRLITADTPKSKLAASIKIYVEEMSKQLSVGTPTTFLSTAGLDNYPPANMSRGIPSTMQAWGAPSQGPLPDFFGGAPLGAGAPPGAPLPGSSFPPGVFASMEAFAPQSAGNFGAVPMSPRFGQPARQQLQPSAVEDGAGSWRSTSVRTHITPGVLDSWTKQTETASSDVLTQPREDYQNFESTLMPEVLFAGFVEVRGDAAVISVLIPDTFAEYQVESFICDGADWKYAVVNFTAEKAEFLELNTPLFATLHDQTLGRIYFRAIDKASSLKLVRNGEPVKLFDVATKDTTMTAKSFQALPGDYRAELLDKNGLLLDSQQKFVLEPGKIKHRVNSMRLLSAGDSLEINNLNGVEEITLLPNIDDSFSYLVETTADYQHCCCEQTACKILSACAMYAFSGDHVGATENGGNLGSGGSGGSGGSDDIGGKRSDSSNTSVADSNSKGNGDSRDSDTQKAQDRRNKAELIIIAGVEREVSLWEKGKGLRLYPNTPVNPQFSALAAQHLLHLQTLKALTSGAKISKRLSEAIEKGLEIAADVSAALKIEYPPKKIQSCEQAYLVTQQTDSERINEAVEFIKAYLDDKKDSASLKDRPEELGISVYARQQSAYAAAVLLKSRALRDRQVALKLADSVTRAFNNTGGLYSTVDSAAAIALLSELKKLNFSSRGVVSINGGPPIATDMVAPDKSIQKIEIVEGGVAVYARTLIEEDWSKLNSQTKITVELLNKEKVDQRNLKLADSVDLIVTIDDDYKDGDLLWVYLPEALSRIFGGVQVKMFSIDFKGQKQISISLAATGSTVNDSGEVKSQYLSICLRNMFNEERCGNPGLLPITVH